MVADNRELTVYITTTLVRSTLNYSTYTAVILTSHVNAETVGARLSLTDTESTFCQPLLITYRIME